jgi:hypothetical protein
MKGIKLAAGLKNALGEKGLVIFNTETGDEGVTGAKEKSTQDPSEARASYR